MDSADKEDSPNLGLPWFVGKDVCDILGTTNPTMVMDRLEPLCLRITDIRYPQNGGVGVNVETVYYTERGIS